MSYRWRVPKPVIQRYTMSAQRNIVPTIAVENFIVPAAMPRTMTIKMYDASSVSRKMLRNRTMANTAIRPKAVTKLFERTIITRATTEGMTIKELTKDFEYDRPVCVAI